MHDLAEQLDAARRAPGPPRARRLAPAAHRSPVRRRRQDGDEARRHVALLQLEVPSPRALAAQGDMLITSAALVQIDTLRAGRGGGGEAGAVAGAGRVDGQGGVTSPLK